MSRSISMWTIENETSGAKGSMVEIPKFNNILVDDITESVWVAGQPSNDTYERVIKYEYSEWDKIIKTNIYNRRMV